VFGLPGGIGAALPEVVPQKLRPRAHVLRVRSKLFLQGGGLLHGEVPALSRLLPQVLAESR